MHALSSEKRPEAAQLDSALHQASKPAPSSLCVPLAHAGGSRRLVPPRTPRAHSPPCPRGPREDLPAVTCSSQPLLHFSKRVTRSAGLALGSAPAACHSLGNLGPVLAPLRASVSSSVEWGRSTRPPAHRKEQWQWEIPGQGQVVLGGGPGLAEMKPSPQLLSLAEETTYVCRHTHAHVRCHR